MLETSETDTTFTARVTDYPGRFSPRIITAPNQDKWRVSVSAGDTVYERLSLPRKFGRPSKPEVSFDSERGVCVLTWKTVKS